MITLDFETRSYAELKKVGSWAYAEHDSTDVICGCWAIDDGEIQVWWPGMNGTDDMPPDLSIALKGGHTIEAHNASFEMAIWKYVMPRKYGWMEPNIHAWRDTMARFALRPGALDRPRYANFAKFLEKQGLIKKALPVSNYAVALQ